MRVSRFLALPASYSLQFLAKGDVLCTSHSHPRRLGSNRTCGDSPLRAAGRLSVAQLRSQKGIEHLREVHVLAPTVLRANDRGAKYRESCSPVPEIWHAYRRSVISECPS